MMDLFQTLLLGSVLAPCIASLAILFFFLNDNDKAVKIAYFAFGFPCIAGVILFFNFDPSETGYAYQILYERMGLQSLGITFHLGLNGVSAPLFAMAGFVGLAAGLAAIKSEAERLPLYLSLLAFMQAGLMGLFASIDLLFYYLFHEFALIPTFLMIGLWGGRDRRSVSLEITIYLTLGALISLGGLVALNVMLDAPKFDFPSLTEAIMADGLGIETQKKIFGLLLFGFGILVALFPFHVGASRVRIRPHIRFHATCRGIEKVWAIWFGSTGPPFVTRWGNFMGPLHLVVGIRKYSDCRSYNSRPKQSEVYDW